MEPQIAITIDWVGEVDTELMQKYSEGEVEPTQVRVKDDAIKPHEKTLLITPRY